MDPVNQHYDMFLKSIHHLDPTDNNYIKLNIGGAKL